MTEDNTPPISVTALRADDYSPDAKNVIISLATKYSIAERKYSVPLECFYDFITDLKRLNALKAAAPIEATSEPADTSKPVEDGLERDRATQPITRGQ